TAVFLSRPGKQRGSRRYRARAPAGYGTAISAAGPAGRDGAADRLLSFLGEGPLAGLGIDQRHDLLPCWAGDPSYTGVRAVCPWDYGPPWRGRSRLWDP